MSIGARCGSCNRELLLVQPVQPSQGFRCPFCGFAFAPAHAAPVTALTEPGSMTGDRLRLDQATVVDPIANALPQAEAKAQQPVWPVGAMPLVSPRRCRTAHPTTPHG
jgi:hypothetical protein